MRKKMELEEVGEGEELFRAAFELSSMGMVLVSVLDGRFLRVNRKFSELMGYSPEELKRMTFSDITHPEDRSQSVKAFAHLSKGASEYSVDKRYVRKDGSVIWTSINSAPIRDQSGQIVSLITVVQDISDRKRSAEERQHSLSLLHAALESTADGILVVDISGRIARYNQVFLRLWRIPEEVITSKDDAKTLEYVFDQLKEPKQFLYRVRQLYARPEAESYDVVHLKDGRVFERYSRPQCLNDKIVGRVWSFRDVTARETAIAELKEVSEKLRRLTTSISDYLWSATIDREGKVISRYCSPVVEKVTGRPPEFYLRGEGHWISTVHPEDRERLLAVMQRMLNRQSDHEEADYRIVLPDGSIRWVRDSARVTYLSSESLRIDGVVSDITERILYMESRERLLQQETHTRAEAEKAVQARDDFLSIAAHELRTPLTPIRMYLQFIQQQLGLVANKLPNGEALNKAIGGANKEFDRFLKLVENVLDVSRISAGRLLLDRSEFDLSELVKGVVERFCSMLKKSECELELSVCQRVMGRWDRMRLEQVMTNLLANAIKYGAKKPIEISVFRNGDLAVIKITDRGIGISREDQERLFQRFERAAPIKHFAGLGLGLFISREIVEAHGGVIRLNSEPGVGSTFTVELPLMPLAESGIPDAK